MNEIELWKEAFLASEALRDFMQFPRGWWENGEDEERIDAAKKRLDEAKTALRVVKG